MHWVVKLSPAESTQLWFAPRQAHVVRTRADGTGVVADDADAVVHIGTRARREIGFGASFVVEGGAHTIGLPLDVGVLFDGDGEGEEGEKKKKETRDRERIHFV